jgi:hypothetical protein
VGVQSVEAHLMDHHGLLLPRKQWLTSPQSPSLLPLAYQLSLIILIHRHIVYWSFKQLISVEQTIRVVVLIGFGGDRGSIEVVRVSQRSSDLKHF